MSHCHTSTGEWQRFEARMRRRRAERCLLRAAAALDADVPDCARAVLAEARALAPDHPDLQEVTGRLQSSLEPPRALKGTISWVPVLLTLTLLSLFAAAGF
jgi:hypothetical protein